MRILAFDTSTAITAVAVIDGDRVLAEDDSAASERHGELLLPRITAVLASAGLALGQLDLVAVGIGPGSFTGLRIGIATAKGLGLATGVRLCGVCSLQALARGAGEHAGLVLAAADAGKGEVYAAAYRRHGDALERVLPPTRALPEALGVQLRALPALSEPVLLCGAGARRHAEALLAGLGPSAALAAPELDVIRGRHVAIEASNGVRAGGTADASSLEPTYLRGSDAKLPDEPLAL
ncbi:MAG: tRNA (adenosine(37)-N6)-threonylcarbamoyltransferase complex dimerization subunit type 1 TsaB [Polyangiales bacterium]